MQPRKFIPLLTPLLLCAFAPSTSSAASTMNDGGVSTTGIVTAGQAAFTTSGTTWGYISSTASYLPNLTTNTLSATTIKTSAPTATNDAATKAYVDTVVAAATTSDKLCRVSSATTSGGNLGGVSGGNAKCAAEFGAGWNFTPDYKLATAKELVDGMIKFYPDKFFINSSSASNACSSWSSTSGNATIFATDSYGNIKAMAGGCANNYPILCCNF